MTHDELATKLRSVLATAAVHRQRIDQATAHLAGRLPSCGDDLAQWSYEEIASAELLLSRFAKLQDLLGARLFRLVADASDEALAPTATFLDLLHRLERIGAIESAAEWRLLRELRKELAHDYPDDPDAAAASLVAIAQAIPALLAVHDGLLRHLRRLGLGDLLV